MVKERENRMLEQNEIDKLSEDDKMMYNRLLHAKSIHDGTYGKHIATLDHQEYSFLTRVFGPYSSNGERWRKFIDEFKLGQKCRKC